jgi:hypothetical protein
VTSIDLALLGQENDGGGDVFVVTGLGARGIAEPRYAG